MVFTHGRFMVPARDLVNKKVMTETKIDNLENIRKNYHNKDVLIIG